MKILLLGRSSYIGSYLADFLIESIPDAEILSVSRAELDFSNSGAESQYANLIEEVQPNVIINCIGAIDSGSFVDAQRLFISNFLPTFIIFDFFKSNSVKKKTVVIILGSNAAGKPRKNYPLYAATKGAELALSRTAEEVFEGTLVNWRYLVLPRLKGGLGSVNYPILELDNGEDQELSKVGHLIGDIILKERLLAGSEDD